MPVVRKTQKLLYLAASVTLAVAVATPVGSDDWGGMFFGTLQSHPQAGLIRFANSGTGAPVLLLGYDQSFGHADLGGALEAPHEPNNIGSTGIDEGQQFEVQLGYQTGATRGYVTLGGQPVETAQDQSDSPVYGVGLSYRLTEDLQFSGEVLHQDRRSLISGSGENGDVLTLRASFRF